MDVNECHWMSLDATECQNLDNANHPTTRMGEVQKALRGTWATVLKRVTERDRRGGVLVHPMKYSDPASLIAVRPPKQDFE